MQLQDALTIPKIFIDLDITQVFSCFFGSRDCFAVHKNNWSVSIQTDLFFHRTYSMPSVAEDL